MQKLHGKKSRRGARLNKTSKPGASRIQFGGRLSIVSKACEDGASGCTLSSVTFVPISFHLQDTATSLNV